MNTENVFELMTAALRALCGLFLVGGMTLGTMLLMFMSI